MHSKLEWKGLHEKKRNFIVPYDISILVLSFTT